MEWHSWHEERQKFLRRFCAASAGSVAWDLSSLAVKYLNFRLRLKLWQTRSRSSSLWMSRWRLVSEVLRSSLRWGLAFSIPGAIWALAAKLCYSQSCRCLETSHAGDGHRAGALIGERLLYCCDVESGRTCASCQNWRLFAAAVSAGVGVSLSCVALLAGRSGSADATLSRSDISHHQQQVLHGSLGNDNSGNRFTTVSLHVAVRAAEMVIRALVLHGTLPNVPHVNVAVFQVACGIIMTAWFYAPGALPTVYRKWITLFADMDTRLLGALQAMRSGTIRYPQHSDILRDYCRDWKIKPELGDPGHGFIPCSTVHPWDRMSCNRNGLRRFIRGWRRAIALYLPVHVGSLLIRAVVLSQSRPLRQIAAPRQPQQHPRKLPALTTQAPVKIGPVMRQDQEGNKQGSNKFHDESRDSSRVDLSLRLSTLASSSSAAAAVADSVSSSAGTSRENCSLVERLPARSRVVLDIFLRGLPFAVLGAARSSAFLGTFIAIIWRTICLVRNAAHNELTLGPSLGSWLCGLSLFLEHPARRTELACYVSPRALQTLWALARARELVRVLPYFDVGLLATSAAVFGYFYELERSSARSEVQSAPDIGTATARKSGDTTIMRPLLRALIHRYLGA